MAQNGPQPITAFRKAERIRRITRIARRMGFVGRIECRHVYSQAGGAQYGLARVPAFDLLMIDAEAFERDADPEDFSLEALIAHERGHQLLARNEELIRIRPRIWDETTEEIFASLLGSLLVERYEDERHLILKAAFDLVSIGHDSDTVESDLEDIRQMLRGYL